MGLLKGIGKVFKSVAPALPIVGGVISGIQRRNQAKRQRKFNLEMWERQNKYNHPKAQMARFEEAGLNPNLIYGQGTPGNAQQMPEMPTALGFNPGDVLNQASSLMDVQGKGIDNAIRRLEKDQVLAETLTVELRESLNHMMYKHLKGEADYSQYEDVMRMVRNWRAGQSEKQLKNKLTKIKTHYQDELKELAKKGLAPQGNQYIQLLEEVINLLTNPLDWFNSMIR